LYQQHRGRVFFASPTHSPRLVEREKEKWSNTYRRRFKKETPNTSAVTQSSKTCIKKKKDVGWSAYIQSKKYLEWKKKHK
jgi:hypothetical protein